MITAAQLRAARGLLDWTRADLAEAAKISPETVKNIEHGTFRPQEGTADAIVKAFAIHDVEFTEDQGVRIKKELVKIFSDKTGFADLLNHCYNVLSSGNAVSRHFNFSDVNIGTYTPELLDLHNERMSKIPGLDAKCLVPDGDRNFPTKYCQYRWLKKEYSTSIPYYSYGDYVVFFMQSRPEFVITSIYSPSLAADLRRQFDVFWNDSAIPK